MTNRNIIEQLQQEAQSYYGVKELEVVSQELDNFTSLPVQPVYFAFKQLAPQETAKLLAKSSPEQREVFLQLDLWNKDIISTKNFEYWLETYILTKDLSLMTELSMSEEFAIYLKSICHISTFDAEDPLYPEHNYYFLTDDNLLLIEYGEDYQYGDQLKLLIKTIYGQLGVEKGYAYLFKIVVDQHSDMEEEAYRKANENLRNYGFVNYFEAVEKLSPFPSYTRLNNFINSKIKKSFFPQELESINQNNILPGTLLQVHDIGKGILTQELNKLENQDLTVFLKFNFVRLFNAKMVTSGKSNNDKHSIQRVNHELYNYLNLGLDYIASVIKEEEIILLNHFDFFQVYQIGISLTYLEMKSLNSEFEKFNLSISEEKFIGDYLNIQLENWHKKSPIVYDNGNQRVVNDLASFHLFQAEVKFLKDFLPYISRFKQTFEKLLDDNLINDSFYFNYRCEDINLETVLLSSLINFHFNSDNEVKKLGISIEELKLFLNQVEIQKLNEETKETNLSQLIKRYSQQFGLSEINGIEDYLLKLFFDNLTGYDFSQMEDTEFEFVGGPLLLKN